MLRRGYARARYPLTPATSTSGSTMSRRRPVSPVASKRAAPLPGTRSPGPSGPVEKPAYETRFHPRWRPIGSAMDFVLAKASANMKPNAPVKTKMKAIMTGFPTMP